MRFTDWETRLEVYLRECHSVPFEWGQHDCCTFALGAVQAMRGDDQMAEFRGRYSTRIGSLRALRRIGAGSLEATLDGKFEQIAPGFAQRGDLVLARDGQGGGALGICLGGFALAVGAEEGREGLVRISRVDWLRAWRVA